MGLDYSYELIADRANADAVLGAVARHLIPEDRDRLLAILPVGPDVGLTTVRYEAPYESTNYLCFSFLFPLDDCLRDYAEDYRPDIPLTDPYPVGCVYCSMTAHERTIVFQATAATTDMSLVFWESASIRATWHTIAEESNAIAVYFDREERVPVPLYLSLQFATPEDEYVFGVASNNQEMIRHAWRHGADVNSSTYRRGESVLMWSLEISRELTQFLLAHGALPNVRDANGQTPLAIAIEKRDFRLTHLLLEHGADPSGPSLDESPLEIAHEIGDPDIIELIDEALASVPPATQ